MYFSIRYHVSIFAQWFLLATEDVSDWHWASTPQPDAVRRAVLWSGLLSQKRFGLSLRRLLVIAFTAVELCFGLWWHGAAFFVSMLGILRSSCEAWTLDDNNCGLEDGTPALATTS